MNNNNKILDIKVKAQADNELFFLQRAVNNKRCVDEIFKEQFKKKIKSKKRGEEFLVRVKDSKSGKIELQMEREKKCEDSHDHRQIQATFDVKNKLNKVHNEVLYHKLNLLIKLRLLEGPLFIHALL